MERLLPLTDSATRQQTGVWSLRGVVVVAVLLVHVGIFLSIAPGRVPVSTPSSDNRHLTSPIRGNEAPPVGGGARAISAERFAGTLVTVTEDSPGRPESHWRFDAMDVFPIESERLPASQDPSQPFENPALASDTLPLQDDTSSEEPVAQGIQLPAPRRLTLTRWVPPRYPAQSVRTNEEGLVVLNVHVQQTGIPDEVRVLRATPWPKLNEAAVQAAHQWRFMPVRSSSGRMDAWAEIELRFSLYRFGFTRIEESIVAFEGLHSDDAGSLAALRGLIEELSSTENGGVVAKLRSADTQELVAAVRRWGAVQEAELQSPPNDAWGLEHARWERHEVKATYRQTALEPTVSVQWRHYKVRHERALVRWKVAFAADGEIWAARADLTRWKDDSMRR